VEKPDLNAIRLKAQYTKQSIKLPLAIAQPRALSTDLIRLVGCVEFAWRMMCVWRAYSKLSVCTANA